MLLGEVTEPALFRLCDWRAEVPATWESLSNKDPRHVSREKSNSLQKREDSRELSAAVSAQFPPMSGKRLHGIGTAAREILRRSASHFEC